MPRRNVTSDDVAREMRRVFGPPPATVRQTITSDEATQGNGNGGGGLTNPMTTAGDLIVGGVDGAPTREPVGGEGEVLAVVAGRPGWVATGTFGFNADTILVDEDYTIMVDEDYNVLVGEA